MERTKLGLSKDKMYKALGEGERTSKKVASIRMSDGSTFKRKNANQYGAAEGGNDYTEKRSNRSDRFDLGGTADSSNTGANMGGTMGSSIMKHGGGLKVNLGSGEMDLEDAIKMYEDKIKSQGRVTNERDENMLKQLKNMRGKMKDGGATKSDYSNIFKEVEDFGNQQYYIRKWGKVGTDKHNNIELLAVAKITDLEDYMSEDELPKDGNFELRFSLVPIEKYISKKHKESANDENVSMGNNTIVNIENYMGGLNYEPQNKEFFKTVNDAKKYLLSKEFNDKISAEGMMSGFILDKKYNRAGQTNWDYLGYMTGERERFAQGGLADVPESFPSNDAVSYKTGGEVGDAFSSDIYSIGDKILYGWNGKYYKQGKINARVDENNYSIITENGKKITLNRKDIDLAPSEFAQGGSTKGFEYTIGGL